jgi:hypothetical protein
MSLEIFFHKEIGEISDDNLLKIAIFIYKNI